MAQLLDLARVQPQLAEQLVGVLATQALGFGAIWRTGALAQHPHVLAGLGLEAGEKIVGFLYVGSFEGERRNPPALQPLDFVSAWQG